MITFLPFFLAFLTCLPGLMSTFVAWKALHSIQQVHIAINSRFDEFLALAKKSSFAEGVLSETSKTPGN